MKILHVAVLMVVAMTVSTMALPVRSDANAERLNLMRQAVLQHLLNNLNAGEDRYSLSVIVRLLAI